MKCYIRFTCTFSKKIHWTTEAQQSPPRLDYSQAAMFQLPNEGFPRKLCCAWLNWKHHRVRLKPNIQVVVWTIRWVFTQELEIFVELHLVSFQLDLYFDTSVIVMGIWVARSIFVLLFIFLLADPMAPDAHNNAERLNFGETLSSHHPFYLIKKSMRPKEFVLLTMGWKLLPRNRHPADVPGN